MRIESNFKIEINRKEIVVLVLIMFMLFAWFSQPVSTMETGCFLIVYGSMICRELGNSIYVGDADLEVEHSKCIAYE